MRILVTGGAGFIGSHLVDRLLQKHHEVVVIDNLSTGHKRNISPKATFYEMDLRDPKVRGVFENHNIEMLFHVAAQKDVGYSVAHTMEDADINIMGSLNLLEAARATGVQHVIFSSTAGAMFSREEDMPFHESLEASPVAPYGISKRAIEMYLDFYRDVYGLRSASLRYANVYGPRQDPHGEAGVVAIFIDRLLRKKDAFIFGDGSKTRDFVYVDDVIDANIAAAEKRAEGIFHIGTTKELSIERLARTVEKVIGVSENTITKKEDKPGEVQRSCIDGSKARRDLGWRPHISLDDGIARTVAWFKKGVRT